MFEGLVLGELFGAFGEFFFDESGGIFEAEEAGFEGAVVGGLVGAAAA